MLEESLATLQNELAMIDAMSEDASPPHLHGMPQLMVLKHKLLRIRIDGSKNHNCPHVHVDYHRAFHTASYSIQDGRKLAGILDKEHDKKVREWIANNKAALLEAWKKTQSGIKPEELIITLMGSNF